MKLLLAGLLTASTLAVAAPAMAQGVYIGPNGVGVGIGHRHYDDYDRDRGDYYGRRHFYEGRSAYDGRDRDYRDRY